MTRTSVALCLLLPLAVTAAESNPAPHSSPFSSYQSWSEPTVRDWRETHRLVADEPSGHAGHGGMTMPESQSKPADKDDSPSSPKAMPGMNHEGREMPPTDSQNGMPHDGEHQ